MTTSFPSDERSPPRPQKQQREEVQHEISDSKKSDSPETKQEQKPSKGFTEKDSEELKAVHQKFVREEEKKAGITCQLFLTDQNWSGLTQLELEYEDLLHPYKLPKAFAGNTIFHLVDKFLIEPADSRKIKKLHQIIPTMRSLLDQFGHQGVVVQPRIDLPWHGSLDLLVRFTQHPKVTFGIAFRSQGDSNIVYNENKQLLYIRRNKAKRGLYPWKPDQIDQLGEQEFWLRKNFRSIFGESARDRNRPMVKLLVLTDDTKLGQHSDHLYETIGDQKVLLLKKRCSVYVMEEKQLMPMIWAWLTHK